MVTARTPEQTMLFGVLVTYRRPDDLAEHLEVLRRQTRAIDHLVVVDNAPDNANRELVDRYVAEGRGAAYVDSPENLGAAGGIGSGMRAVLLEADDEDWVVLLDDDNPPRAEHVIGDLYSFACANADDPAVAAVGLTGATFDWKQARLVRPADEELVGVLDVDFVGGGQFPMIRVGAIRQIGTFRDELFWGFDDLEFGLRLRRAGYRILLSGDLARWARTFHGRLGGGYGGWQITATKAPWRQYYTLRNMVFILRQHGRNSSAVKVAVTRGIAKTLLNGIRRPRGVGSQLRVCTAAIADGWRGRLGRRMEPGATIPDRDIAV
jgi:hypothetical protein